MSKSKKCTRRSFAMQRFLVRLTDPENPENGKDRMPMKAAIRITNREFPGDKKITSVKCGSGILERFKKNGNNGNTDTGVEEASEVSNQWLRMLEAGKELHESKKKLTLPMITEKLKKKFGTEDVPHHTTLSAYFRRKNVEVAKEVNIKKDGRWDDKAKGRWHEIMEAGKHLRKTKGWTFKLITEELGKTYNAEELPHQGTLAEYCRRDDKVTGKVKDRWHEIMEAGNHLRKTKGWTFKLIVEELKKTYNAKEVPHPKSLSDYCRRVRGSDLSGLSCPGSSNGSKSPNNSGDLLDEPFMVIGSIKFFRSSQESNVLIEMPKDKAFELVVKESKLGN